MSERDRHAKSLRSDAQEIVESLPEGVTEVSIVCPLCESSTRARGLMAEHRPRGGAPEWLIAFTCPTCGLNTTYAREDLDLERMASRESSPWTQKLRAFSKSPRKETVPHERTAFPRQMIAIIFVSFATWLVLTGDFRSVNLIWGFIVSIVVGRLAYRLVAVSLPAQLLQPRRWVHFFGLLYEFTRQLIVQNISLSIRVLRPNLPIRPGILAVPSSLEGEFKLALLGSLLSLTPHTVAMDIDEDDAIIYLHWIDAETQDPEEAKRILLDRMENRIRRWLE